MMQLNEQANDRRRIVEGVVCLVLFGLTIPAANWLIGHVGTECVPNGPCLIPVAPGLMAPSGVTMIGIALVLRDLVQRRLGVGVAVVAIIGRRRPVGADRAAALVIASTVAFLMSEFADLAVYTPLARRRLIDGRGGLEHGRAGRRLDRVPLARLRLARLPAGPDRRQGLDGAGLDPVRGVAAPPRRAARVSCRPRPFAGSCSRFVLHVRAVEDRGLLRRPVQFHHPRRDRRGVAVAHPLRAHWQAAR